MRAAPAGPPGRRASRGSHHSPKSSSYARGRRATLAIVGRRWMGDWGSWAEVPRGVRRLTRWAGVACSGRSTGSFSMHGTTSQYSVAPRGEHANCVADPLASGRLAGRSRTRRSQARNSCRLGVLFGPARGIVAPAGTLGGRLPRVIDLRDLKASQPIRRGPGVELEFPGPCRGQQGVAGRFVRLHRADARSRSPLLQPESRLGGPGFKTSQPDDGPDTGHAAAHSEQRPCCRAGP